RTARCRRRRAPAPCWRRRALCPRSPPGGGRARAPAPSHGGARDPDRRARRAAAARGRRARDRAPRRQRRRQRASRATTSEPRLQATRVWSARPDRAALGAPGVELRGGDVALVVQRPVDARDEVVGVLDADAEADQAIDAEAGELLG